MERATLKIWGYLSVKTKKTEQKVNSLISIGCSSLQIFSLRFFLKLNHFTESWTLHFQAKICYGDPNLGGYKWDWFIWRSREILLGPWHVSSCLKEGPCVRWNSSLLRCDRLAQHITRFYFTHKVKASLNLQVWSETRLPLTLAFSFCMALTPTEKRTRK